MKDASISNNTNTSSQFSQNVNVDSDTVLVLNIVSWQCLRSSKKFLIRVVSKIALLTELSKAFDCLYTTY